MRLKALALCAPILFAAPPVLAHHSFTAFDLRKALMVTGEVKKFEWTNPHARIDLLALDENGKPQEYEFEMPSLSQDARAGWRKDSVKVGDVLTVQYHPYKKIGSYGGMLVGAILPDGAKLGPPPRDEFLSGFGDGRGRGGGPY